MDGTDIVQGPVQPGETFRPILLPTTDILPNGMHATIAAAETAIAAEIPIGSGVVKIMRTPGVFQYTTSPP
jgi:hypothetical protein